MPEVEVEVEDDTITCTNCGDEIDEGGLWAGALCMACLDE